MRVLIIGAGKAVEGELAKINRFDFDMTIGVNQAAIDFGPVDIHVTLHPEEYGPRKAAWLVAHRQCDGVNEVHPCQWRPGGRSGSSGLYAVKYALERLQADGILLAGIGMDIAPHYNNRMDWPQAEVFRQTWMEALPRLTGKVKSMGGWTAQLLNAEHETIN